MYRLGAVLILFFAAPVVSQGGETAFFRGGDFSGTVKAAYWRTGGRNILQTVMPLVYSHAFTRQFSLDVTTSPAWALASDQEMILGVASTKVRASYILGDMVLLTAGARVPSGTNNLSPSQAVTAGALANRPLSFAVPSFTGGLNACATAATAYAFGFVGPGELAAGLAASYQYKGGFSPLSGGPEYDPGDEIGANLSGEYTLTAGEKVYRLSAAAAFTFFFTDTYAEKEIFKPGLQTVFNAVLSAGTASRYENLANLCVSWNAKGDPFDTDGKIRELAGLANFDVILGDRMYLPGDAPAQPYLAGAFKYYGANDLGANRAWLLFAGAGLSSTPAARGFALTGQGGLNAGFIDGNFSVGLEIGGGIKYAF